MCPPKIHEYGVIQLERLNPLKTRRKKGSGIFCSSCPLGVREMNRGMCPGPVSLLGQHRFLALLAETHRSDGEAKLVCEVSASHWCYVSQGEQMEVLELKHRLPRSRKDLLSRLTHRKQNIYLFYI